MKTPRGVLVWVALVIVAGSLDPLPWLPGQPSTAVLAQVVLEPVKPFRVFVVHSYTLENEWTEAQVSGFTQVRHVLWVGGDCAVLSTLHCLTCAFSHRAWQSLVTRSRLAS